MEDWRIGELRQTCALLMDGTGAGASIKACAVQKNAFSAGVARRTGHGAKAFRGRRNCADAAEARRRGRGRYSDPDHAPAYADGCAGLRRSQRRWRSGSETRHANAPHANRGGERPRKPSNLCGNGWSARRPHPKAIFRLSSGADASANGHSRTGRTVGTFSATDSGQAGRVRDWVIGRLEDWSIGGFIRNPQTCL